MPLQATAMLGLAMRFDVEVDGIDLGGWASCKGLKVNFNLLPVKEGGTNDHVFWLHDRMSYEHITLTRAMTKTDSLRVAMWLSECVDKDQGGTAKITLKDAHSEEVASWNLRGVLPFSWEGPSLDANGHEVARETLVLAHEGFL